MNVQNPYSGYYVKELRRTIDDFDEALYSQEVDAPTLAIDEYGNNLPYYTQIFLTPGETKDLFEITKRSDYQVKIFIFDNDEEKKKFMETGVFRKDKDGVIEVMPEESNKKLTNKNPKNYENKKDQDCQ